MLVVKSDRFGRVDWHALHSRQVKARIADSTGDWRARLFRMTCLGSGSKMGSKWGVLALSHFLSGPFVTWGKQSFKSMILTGRSRFIGPEKTVGLGTLGNH